ncbi:VWA domain-containing protein [Actinokineospora spheciospongiae]|uniref:VWA domain-containing protein n=1 Tax=Actinokineospora spheciospongiae TaxID=909613 RepID=UPI000D71D224|nr:VWA domain-containing protein [Actinokineospora spheciospongiae]PWW66722.1 Ca-activated chloride channel family protein [Actinokineospora spheciospongiae]
MTEGFELAVHHWPHLARGATELHAVLRITGGGSVGAAAGSVESAVVFAIDCSGSMCDRDGDQPTDPTRIAAARAATAAGIDALPDGSWFAVVAGTHRADVVFPGAPELVRADPGTRAAAKSAVRHLTASGGTAMSTWLRAADALLSGRPGAVRHAVLLTDGKNQTERAGELARALAEVRGRFVCDARGIGTDWDPEDVRAIAEATHGTADSVRAAADLTEDFAAILRTALGRTVPDLRLRVRTAGFATVGLLRQVHPATADLVGVPAADGSGAEYPTGAWGAESREYHLRLDLDPTGYDVEEQLLAASLDLVPPAPGATARPVLMCWTDDVQRSSHVDPGVSHYTGQADLSAAMIAGYDAHDHGDHEAARREWGQALALATGLGNTGAVRLLERLVEVVDGEVRLRPDIAAADVLRLGVRSTHSVRPPRVRPERSEPPAATGPPRACHGCAGPLAPNHLFCAGCGTGAAERA